MTPFIVLVAASLVGVEAGWEPQPDGGHLYTIQIEPSLIRQLQSGNDLVSEVPPNIHVRRFRITIGTGALARIDGPADAAEQPDAEPPAPARDEALAAPGMPPDFGERDPHASEAEASPPTETDSPAIPANFNQPPNDAQPLAQPPTSAPAEPQPHNAEKPRLDPGAVVAGTAEPGEPSPPWVPFLVAAVLLACSLGANLYLGWVAWDARSRYRMAMTRLRTAHAG